EAHHVAGLGAVLGDFRVDVNAVVHGNVAHVLDAADDEDVTVAGHDGLGGGVQRLHGGAAQAVDGLGGAGARHVGQHGDVAGNVHALFQGLVDAAPDHVFGGGHVPVGVARFQRFHQGGGQFFSAHVTELAVTAF